MKFVWSTLLTLPVLLNLQTAHAQLDSSYELLLGVPVPAENARAESAKPAASKRRKIATESEAATESSAKTATKGEAVQENSGNGPLLPSKMQPAPGEAAVTATEPSLTFQATNLFSEPEKVLTYYNQQFEETDPRQNKVEILFAPTFVSNDSASNYSYRNYRSVFSAVSVGANIWLTPALGLGGNFLFSLGADTSGDAGTGTRSPAHHELFDIALKFRQFYGFSSLSKAMEFAILYTDYKLNVPSDDLFRARLKTSGLGLKATLRVPTTPDFAWLLGGSFYPRLQHSETAAGRDISSGENSENVRIGLHLGADYKLSRESQIFWEASATSERNLFGGSASLIDPANGGIPKNVSVTNSFYLMSLGYRWGN